MNKSRYLKYIKRLVSQILKTHKNKMLSRTLYSLLFLRKEQVTNSQIFNMRTKTIDNDQIEKDE